jgi:phosphopantetheinyl transferase (holo-ACP synthase)
MPFYAGVFVAKEAVMKRTSMVLAALLGALGMLAGAGVVNATPQYRYDDACARRVANRQADLDRAVARHGIHSRQADHARWELSKVETSCGYR